MMKKSTFFLTIALVFVFLLSGCSREDQNEISSSITDIDSSQSSVAFAQKSNDEVKEDTDKEFARYQALYPNEEFIVDKITPVIHESVGSDSNHTNYTIDFSDAYSSTISIELPKELSIRLYEKDERVYASLKDMDVQPFYSSAVAICNQEDEVIGGISTATIMCPDDIIPGEDNSALIYQGLFTGMGNTWDIGYTPISLTETECTATTYISYPDYALEGVYPHDFARVGNSVDLGGGERYFFNKAILSYNTDKLKYIAVEIDFDCISDAELLSTAKSIKLT